MDQPKAFGPWHVLSRLGQGGQGTVYKVRKGQDPRNGPVSQLVSAIGAVGDFACQGQETWANRRSRKDFPLNDTERLRQLIDEYATATKSLELGAAKSLHHVDDDGLREKALARLAHEVEVLQQTSHPSIVKILDARPSDGWFVTELYEGGTLASCPRAFAGKIESALLAFRPLVEAAAALHAKNIVHRDIKPENVFLGADNRLVLGDMGIVYFLDNAHTRVSETYENVGSHIWMQDCPARC